MLAKWIINPSVRIRSDFSRSTKRATNFLPRWDRSEGRCWAIPRRTGRFPHLHSHWWYVPITPICQFNSVKKIRCQPLIRDWRLGENIWHDNLPFPSTPTVLTHQGQKMSLYFPVQFILVHIQKITYSYFVSGNFSTTRWKWVGSSRRFRNREIQIWRWFFQGIRLRIQWRTPRNRS